MALAYVPPDDVKEAFKKLVAVDNLDQRLKTFSKYFQVDITETKRILCKQVLKNLQLQDTYIGTDADEALFPIALWNVHKYTVMSAMKTNNVVEVSFFHVNPALQM